MIVHPALSVPATAARRIALWDALFGDDYNDDESQKRKTTEDLRDCPLGVRGAGGDSTTFRDSAALSFPSSSVGSFPGSVQARCTGGVSIDDQETVLETDTKQWGEELTTDHAAVCVAAGRKAGCTSAQDATDIVMGFNSFVNHVRVKTEFMKDDDENAMPGIPPGTHITAGCKAIGLKVGCEALHQSPETGVDDAIIDIDYVRQREHDDHAHGSLFCFWSGSC